jgi:hypothetical protein
MDRLAIECKPVGSDYRNMSTKWTSQVARTLAGIFYPPEAMPAEFVDRDAERVRRELELIRIRFPHHG